jgi:hypothetical protein
MLHWMYDDELLIIKLKNGTKAEGHKEIDTAGARTFTTAAQRTY